MNKIVNYSYGGMVQDTSTSKFPNTMYFEGNNIRILATDSQSSYSVTNEKGNSFILSIPSPTVVRNANSDGGVILYDTIDTPYTTTQLEMNVPDSSGPQTIIGQCTTRDYIVLFTTDENGFDCIWKVAYESTLLELIYCRNMEFSLQNPIQVLNNFENLYIDKIYWITGKSQINFLNLNQSIENGDPVELMDVPQDSIEASCNYELTQPQITDIISGGSHTAGMIQYAYNLYRVNSSQSKLSPLSVLVPLDRGADGGGLLNELVDSVPIVQINNIDEDYTNIRVYSIKYTSFNQLPTISIINDSLIATNRSLEIYDDGGIALSTLSIEEFLFVGSDVLIPQHINNKYNRLFSANTKELNFKIDVDTRAYSFNASQESVVYDQLFLNPGSPPAIQPFPSGTPYDILYPEYTLAENNDAVNLYPETYLYQQDGVTIGGEGKYLKYELTKQTTNDNNSKFFKDEEFYRIGIQFYNSYGQLTLPNWIADIKAPKGNLNNSYNTLSLTLKQSFYDDILHPLITANNYYEIPIGYKVLTAERTSNDRTIVANGMISPMMFDDKSGNGEFLDLAGKIESSKSNPKIPNMLVRNCSSTGSIGSTRPLSASDNLKTLIGTGYDSEFPNATGVAGRGGTPFQFNSMLQLYSPEIIFKNSVFLSDSLKLKVKGVYKNTNNNAWGKVFDQSGVAKFEGVAYGGLSTYYANSTVGTFEAFADGLVTYPRLSEPDRVSQIQFYRGYGPLTEALIAGATPSNVIKMPNAFIFTFATMLLPQALLSIDTTRTLVTFGLDTTYTAGYFECTVNSAASTCPAYTITISSTYTFGGIGAAYPPASIAVAANSTGVLNYPITFQPEYPSQVSNPISFQVSITTVGNAPMESTITAEANIVGGVNNATMVSTDSPFLLNQVYLSNVTSFIPTINNVEKEIYGSPEVTEIGADFRSYEGNQVYRYTNSYKSVLTNGDVSWKESGDFGRKIVSINSYNNRCITMVLDDDPDIDPQDRTQLEDLFNQTGLTGDDAMLIVELVKNDTDIFLGNLYGGNSWEDKKRTPYIEVGEYVELVPTDLTSSVYIESPGDTFVGSFKFTRATRTDTTTYQQGYYQFCEIVEYPTETTIDLSNRTDLSLTDWNNKFQPKFDEYQQYNQVYSQQANLIRRRSIDYNIKKISNFDTRIISSRLKSAGELIDSWTDILPNEFLDLNGKHGPINSLIDFNDELFAIQDKALAFLSINPRIQIQGDDGIAVQLGTGNVLDKYKYISTSGGTINKWSVVSTPQAIYFFDLLNKSFNVMRDQLQGLSDNKAMHVFFRNNTNDAELSEDNPIIKSGISSGYDYINGDVFMTFLQEDKPSFTIAFNEKSDSFTSFYDYKPSLYISRGNTFVTTNPNNNSIYRQYAGNYGRYYGVNYKSSITFNLNPEPTKDCVFDNIGFKTDVTIDGVDQPETTLSNIRAYNDYQDSGLTNLVVGRDKNLRRKFRDWNALIPREGRYRIRAPYIKLYVDFDNNNNLKLVLHDVQVSYTAD